MKKYIIAIILVSNSMITLTSQESLTRKEREREVVMQKMARQLGENPNQFEEKFQQFAKEINENDFHTDPLRFSIKMDLVTKESLHIRLKKIHTQKNCFEEEIQYYKNIDITPLMIAVWQNNVEITNRLIAHEEPRARFYSYFLTTSEEIRDALIATMQLTFHTKPGGISFEIPKK